MYPCLGSVSDKRIKVSVLIKHEQKSLQGNWRQLPSLLAKMPLKLYWHILANLDSLVFLGLE